jgi:hypothetical protein
MDGDRELSVVAARQHGIFSFGDTESCGFTPKQRRTRLASGLWMTVHDGAYRIAGAPPTWRGELLAACWAGGFRSVASHRSALAVYDLPGKRERVAEITTPRWRRARHSGIAAHETCDLPESDITHVDAIRVTTPVRTLIDAAAVLHISTLELAVDEALRRGVIEFDPLWLRLDELAKPGRRGIRPLRRILLSRHPDAGLTQSVCEHLLLTAIRKAGLPAPVLQHEVRDPSGRLVARLDASYPDRRIAIEYDSYLHHGARAKYVRDLDRRNRLTALHWSVLHVTGSDLRAEAEGLAAKLRSLLDPAA